MIGKIIRTSGYLYDSDRLWRLSVNLCIGGGIAILLFSFWENGFSKPSATPKINNSASYTPKPPPKFGSSKTTIAMRPTPKMIESDNRLKSFQIAAQKIPGKFPHAGYCEQLILEAQNITSYDRNRAAPIHKKLLSDADICQDRMDESDERLSNLNDAVIAFQGNENYQNAKTAAEVGAAILPFDKQRTDFAQYDYYMAIARKADKWLKNSHQRLSDLRSASAELELQSSKTAENAVFDALDKITPFDRQTPDETNQNIITLAEKLKHAVNEREKNLRELRRLFEQPKHDKKWADTVVEVIESLPQDGWLSAEDTELVMRALQTTFQLQLEYLRNRIAEHKQKQTPETFEAVANQLDLLNNRYDDLLTRAHADILDEAEEIKEILTASNRRLKSLDTAAEQVEKKVTPQNVKALLTASNALTPLDKSRMKQKHQTAIEMASQAESGVLESDDRIEAFNIAVEKFRQNGCNRSSLNRLKETEKALTDFDRERGGHELSMRLEPVSDTLKRGYCLEKQGIITIKPAEPL